ncbi:MAG: hypothetical protein HYY96_03895 [Candidatus Tectomicrobia bacterium]|nr:hypothetical protein [Candidatus Tectomicrobia bacterium]
MAASNHERIGKALELLNRGLIPFIEREMQAAHGEQWRESALASFPSDHPQAKGRGAAGSRAGETPALPSDTQILLAVLWNEWNLVFKKTLGHAERSLVSELREVRNQWAHQQSFNTDDAYRAFDSMQRLLSAIAAPEAAEIERQKQELLRIRFEEQARRESKRDAGKIAEEVIQHLAGLVGAEVEVTLEIQAKLPNGAPDHIVRTVTENCRTLKFKDHGFEEEE